MRSVWITGTAAVFAAGLIVVALWAWQSASDIAIEYWGAGRPEVAAWSVRSAAVSVIAAAQAIAVAFVAGRVFRRGAFDTALVFTAGALFAVGLVSALACGVAGR